MPSPADLLESIQESTAGLNVAELLVRHPQIPRRTAQRWIQQLLREGKVRGTGKGRARRYLAVQSLATGVARMSFPISSRYPPTAETSSRTSISRCRRALLSGIRGTF